MPEGMAKASKDQGDGKLENKSLPTPEDSGGHGVFGIGPSTMGVPLSPSVGRWYS